MRGRDIAGLRQCGFLEVDILPIVESVTKYAAFVESPERARFHIEKAIHLARSGRPGPVLLDVPLDVQAAPFPEDSEGYVPAAELASSCDSTALDNIFARLAKAKRPLILAGHGIRVADKVAEFRELVNPIAGSRL